MGWELNGERFCDFLQQRGITDEKVSNRYRVYEESTHPFELAPPVVAL